MPSVPWSGIFSSWLTCSGVPDPLFSIQQQNPAASFLPQPFPAYLTISHPSCWCVCVCMYITTIMPCSPSLPWRPMCSCHSAAQHAPDHDLARFLIFPFLPPVSEGNRIAHRAPPSRLHSVTSQVPVSALSFTRRAASPACWLHHVRSIWRIPS